MLGGKKLTNYSRKSMQKKNWNKSQKLKKAYFRGYPLIQAVEAKMLGHLYKYYYIQKIFVPDK